ncbi:MAG TPA: hypothetical protein VG797_04370 [Phycisphaerales bacterium]|nr:hypothetical protein [Phycisphaerales bacterium]
MQRITLAMVVGALGFVASSCPAQLVTESMLREVRVTGLGALFDSTAASGQYSNALASSGNNQVSQHSNIASCGADIEVESFSPAGQATGSTDGTLRYVFHVDQPTNFVIAGRTTTTGSHTPVSHIVQFNLTGGAINIQQVGAGTWSITGTFQPGVSYTFFARAGSQSGGPSNWYIGKLYLYFHVSPVCDSEEAMGACAIDRGQDHVVGLDEVAKVVQGWGAPAPAGAVGDYNLDGVVGLADIAMVISHWGETCPYDIE